MATGEYAAAWDARNAANKLRERERISAEERTFDAPESTLATSQLLARHGQAEIRCKTTGFPDEAECGQALIDVARMALRAGARRAR